MTILQLKKVKLLLLFYFMMPDPKSNSSSIGSLVIHIVTVQRTHASKIQIFLLGVTRECTHDRGIKITSSPSSINAQSDQSRASCLVKIICWFLFQIFKNKNRKKNNCFINKRKNNKFYYNFRKPFCLKRMLTFFEKKSFLFLLDNWTRTFVNCN